MSGPGTTLQDASANRVEIWHDLRENLPAGVAHQEVLFQFVTKQGYGKNVLQRASSVLATLERARPALHQRS